MDDEALRPGASLTRAPGSVARLGSGAICFPALLMNAQPGNPKTVQVRWEALVSTMETVYEPTPGPSEMTLAVSSEVWH